MKKIVTNGQMSSTILNQLELDNLVKRIVDYKVLLKGHYVLNSLAHSEYYFNKDGLYIHADLVSDLCRIIAMNFKDDDVDIVIAPAIGGVILSHLVARYLSEICNREIFGVFAEKTNNGSDFIIKRGYDKFLKGKNVLVLEDVVTTGRSVKRVVNTTRVCGGNVVGLSVICNRNNVTSMQVGDPPKFISLLDVNLESWQYEQCPLCRNAIIIDTSIGHGEKFLREHPEWYVNEAANSD